MKRSTPLLLIALLGLGACSADGESVEEIETSPAPGELGIPTRGLQMLAEIQDLEVLEQLFHSGDASSALTIDRVKQEMEELGVDSMEIKAEGIPLFSDTVVGSSDRLGLVLSRAARQIWSGKFFTFNADAAGNLTGTLKNAILGDRLINAKVYVADLADAMSRRGESDPGITMVQR